MEVGRRSLRESPLRDVVNALHVAKFADADWDLLGVQLNVPQHQLDNIRANHPDVATRLTNMITQWLNSDRNASWEGLADALRRIGKYGLATAENFQQAVGLDPEPSSGQNTPGQANDGSTARRMVGGRNKSAGKWQPRMTYLLILAIVIGASAALLYTNPQIISAVGTSVSRWVTPQGSDVDERDTKGQQPLEDAVPKEESSVKLCTEITNVQHTFKGLKEFSKWRQLGAELNISDSALDVIDIDERKVASKTEEVLRKWFNKNEKVCWEDLVAALKAIDEAYLAKKIANEYTVPRSDL